MPLNPGLKIVANVERRKFVADASRAQSKWIGNPSDHEKTFLQLPPTRDTPPSKNERPNTDRKPPHRKHGWPKLKLLGYVPPATLRSSFEVHEYKSPRSKVGPSSRAGWYVIQRLKENDEVYQIVENVGGVEHYRTMLDFVKIEDS